MKRCWVCKQDKPESAFARDRSRKDGLCNRCKECDNSRLRNYWATSKGKVSRSKAVKKIASGVREYILSIKNKGCSICGYHRTVNAIEFHHLGDKEHALSDMATYPIESIERELAKCIVVCANCHREIHAGMLDVGEFQTRACSGAKSANQLNIFSIVPPPGRGPTPRRTNTPREHALAQNLKRGSKWARKKVARAVAEEAEAAESNG